jgi:hypothetical protein
MPAQPRGRLRRKTTAVSDAEYKELESFRNSAVGKKLWTCQRATRRGEHSKYNFEP